MLNFIDEVEKKKYDIFMSTFKEVNAHFTKLYSYVFPDKAEIELSDPKDIFNSGLYIKITDQNGTGSKYGQMSGGQKSLIMLMLIFSIHMYKPSPLYIFDEIDNALDKVNTAKLSHLIKELSKKSQFLIVSHNDTLIIDADSAIGVTKPNYESKAVGIELSSILNGSTAGAPGSGEGV